MSASVMESSMAELIIQSGKLQGKRLVLPEKEVLIGRDEECHVRLASSLVSRRHCVLHGSPEGLWVRDLSSQNGTFVNDVQVTEPVLLKPGDVLLVGATQFQVPPQKHAAEPAAAEHAAGKTKPVSEKISDAEIANWLSDLGENSSVKPSDTTIIKNPAPPANLAGVSSVRTAPPTPLPAAAGGDGARRAPRTVKEQAAEIIRKHWADVRGEVP